MSNTPPKPRVLREAATLNVEPTWDIAKLFPSQGAWSEWEYMELRPSRVVEYDHGYVEIHDVPSQSHQFIVSFLYQALLAFVTARNLGSVLFAPLRVKLGPETQKIIVLKLEGEAYVVHGDFAPGDSASSALLNGFSVSVEVVFAAAKQ
jgi:hypothetical protein